MSRAGHRQLSVGPGTEAFSPDPSALVLVGRRDKSKFTIIGMAQKGKAWGESASCTSGTVPFTLKDFCEA